MTVILILDYWTISPQSIILLMISVLVITIGSVFKGHSPITREEMTLQDRESVSPSNQGGAIIHVVGFCYCKIFSYRLFSFYITSRGTYIYT